MLSIQNWNVGLTDGQLSISNTSRELSYILHFSILPKKVNSYSQPHICSKVTFYKRRMLFTDWSTLWVQVVEKNLAILFFIVTTSILVSNERTNEGFQNLPYFTTFETIFIE